MSTALLIVIIAVVVLLGLGLFVLPRLRAARHARRLEQERLDRQMKGHREEAAGQTTTADQVAQAAEAERKAAEEHAARAENLEDEAARARRSAAFHDQRAEETKEELD
jgi:flagellar biosynthesis/type III secretory pathway M-ring protein FliF/YscJ